MVWATPTKYSTIWSTMNLGNVLTDRKDLLHDLLHGSRDDLLHGAQLHPQMCDSVHDVRKTPPEFVEQTAPHFAEGSGGRAADGFVPVEQTSRPRHSLSDVQALVRRQPARRYAPRCALDHPDDFFQPTAWELRQSCPRRAARHQRSVRRYASRYVGEMIWTTSTDDDGWPLDADL